MTMITSPHNEKLKLIRRLGMRRSREREYHDEGQDGEQYDHDREYRYERRCSPDRSDLLARHLSQRFPVTTHR